MKLYCGVCGAIYESLDLDRVSCPVETCPGECLDQLEYDQLDYLGGHLSGCWVQAEERLLN